MPEDLWPTTIDDGNLVTPVSILKEQAALLGEKTRQLVTGEVVTQTTGSLFVHHFYIVAPGLNYRYELFSVQHHINFFPLVIQYLNHTTSVNQNDNFHTFKQHLKEIFSSPTTLNIIQSILAQLRA